MVGMWVPSVLRLALLTRRIVRSWAKQYHRLACELPIANHAGAEENLP
jgi:hypothetical protein